MLFTIIGICLCLHPIFNELIFWGVLSSAAFATFLTMYGATEVFSSKSKVSRITGILLMTLGAWGIQLLAAVGAALVYMELVHKGSTAFSRQPRGKLLDWTGPHRNSHSAASTLLGSAVDYPIWPGHR